MNRLFVENIEAYCRANGITVKEFARRCGFDNSAVNQWRKGASPSLKILEQISNATGISIGKWVEKKLA